MLMAKIVFRSSGSAEAQWPPCHSASGLGPPAYLSVPAEPFPRGTVPSARIAGASMCCAKRTVQRPAPDEPSAMRSGRMAGSTRLVVSMSGSKVSQTAASGRHQRRRTTAPNGWHPSRWRTRCTAMRRRQAVGEPSQGTQRRGPHSRPRAIGGSNHWRGVSEIGQMTRNRSIDHNVPRKSRKKQLQRYPMDID